MRGWPEAGAARSHIDRSIRWLAGAGAAHRVANPAAGRRGP